jgi:hypothetical protein
MNLTEEYKRAHAIIVEMARVLTPEELADALLDCCLGVYACQVANSIMDAAVSAAPEKAADFVAVTFTEVS